MFKPDLQCGSTNVDIVKNDPVYASFPYAKKVMDELQPKNFFGEQLNTYIINIDCIQKQNIPVDEKYEKALPMIEKLFKILWSRKQFVEDKIFWEELYHKYTYFYKFLNSHPVYGNIKGIPVVKVTKHNDAAWYWVNVMKDKNLKTLGQVMHVDTHADSNDVQYPIELKDIGRKILDGTATNEDWKKYRALSWDIGAAVTSYQIMTKTEDWYWIVPKWIRHREYEADVIQGIYNRNGRVRKDDPSILMQMHDEKDKLVASRFFGFGIKKLPNDGPDIQKIRVPKKEQSLANEIANGNLSGRVKELFHTLEPATFKLRKPDGNVKKWRKIGKALTDTYILDIDLDYFCSNGIDSFEKKEYNKTGYDVYSHGRHNIPDFTMYPRAISDPKRNEKANKSTMKSKAEVKLIIQRINEFAKGIKALKTMGKIPSVISISDSTGVNFTETEYFSASNEYLPRYYALFVHMFVVNKLKDIFN